MNELGKEWLRGYIIGIGVGFGISVVVLVIT